LRQIHNILSYLVACCPSLDPVKDRLLLFSSHCLLPAARHRGDVDEACRQKRRGSRNRALAGALDLPLQILPMLPLCLADRVVRGRLFALQLAQCRAKLVGEEERRG
jgi:hypothetical protein